MLRFSTYCRLILCLEVISEFVKGFSIHHIVCARRKKPAVSFLYGDSFFFADNMTYADSETSPPSFGMNEEWNVPMTDDWYETQRIMLSLQNEIAETRHLLNQEMHNPIKDILNERDLEIQKLQDELSLKETIHKKETSRLQEELKRVSEQVLYTDGHLQEKNGKISALTRENESLQNTIDQLVEDIRALETQNEYLSVNMALLEAHIIGLTKEIKSQMYEQEELSKLKNGTGNADEDNVSTIPTVKGVFCGYVTTEEERLRLKDAKAE